MKKTFLMLLLALVAGAAHADSSLGTPLNQFTPPAGDTSVDFMREVFGNIVGLVSSGGNLQNGQTNDVLGSMMKVFNSAVLFLGMLFVGYTTIKGTVDSAHDGEILGKKMSSIWLPLRSVGGLALLLPLGSGYSLVQIGILWLALQGVGVADAIWKAAIEQISRDNMISRPMIPDSRPLAANILKFEVCAAAMNKQFQDSGRSTRIQPISANQVLTNTGEVLNYDVFDTVPAVGAYTTTQNFSNAQYTVTSYQWKANDNSYLNPVVCGGIAWKQSWEASAGNSNTKVIKAPIMEAHAKAVQAMIQELLPVASQIVSGQKPTAGAIDQAANNYENALRTAAKNAVSQTNDRARSDFLQAAKDGGWIFAGTWYNHIVKMNDVMQSTLNGLPTSEPIDITDKETKDALQTYQDAMAAADEYTKNRVDGIRQVYYNQTDVRAPQQGEGAWEYVRKLISAPFMGAINLMTQSIAGSNLNHMSQMKSFGDTIVGAGEALLATMAAATGTANSAAAKATVGLAFDVGAVIQFLSGLVTTLTIALFFFGAVLSTYVPMIPFITWMTSVVNWFVLTLESVIAGPLFSVAHVHPDGDDAVGKAGHGYMMILSLVMRPSLMLFGLIGGMLLTQPVVGLINIAFMTVVAGVQADSTTGIVSFFAYVAIYVTVMTTVVHIVFSLIHWIPDNILRWVGAHAGGIAGAEGAGDKGHDILVGGAREAKHGATGSLGGKKLQRPDTQKMPTEGAMSNDELLPPGRD
ncbi:DotA/TraY family protein [Ralstonia sp. SM1884_UCD616_TZ26]|uniref:DotA/TraY family protein n=1 Tax=Ralstonia pseudosolanacearum TaxID=1310165 RepID=UPI003391D064